MVWPVRVSPSRFSPCGGLAGSGLAFALFALHGLAGSSFALALLALGGLAGSGLAFALFALRGLAGAGLAFALFALHVLAGSRFALSLLRVRELPCLSRALIHFALSAFIRVALLHALGPRAAGLSIRVVLCKSEPRHA